MAKSKNLQEMREKLIELYPRGVIRGQRIIDMPENQIYAIYKSHIDRKIRMGQPRMIHVKQVPGQMNMLADM